jgi:hypothetical protein
MWAGTKDAFMQVATDELRHTIDTARGQSGSSIRSANIGAWFLGYIVGIHSYGGPLWNSGTRIHSELLNDLLIGCSVMGCSINSYAEPAASPTPTPTPTPSPSPRPTPTPCPPNPFVDVCSDHWAHDQILDIFNAEITTGCATDPLSYCPDDSVTRVQMAAFLLRAMEHDDYLPPYQGYFNDIPAGQWFTGFVEHLFEHNITTGCSTSPPLYCPFSNVTREQMAVFIIRALEEDPVDSPSGVFPDVPPEHWAAGYIEQLAELEITTGKGDGTYGPNDAVTRAQMAAFIVRAWDLPLP